MYIEFMDYKLRLTTRGVANVEYKIGRNPLELLLDIDNGKMPRMRDIIVILHEALQPYQHDLKQDDAYDILDKYAEEGHTIFDFISGPFIELLKQAGIINPDVNKEDVEEKN